jgi:predicted ArsR family transcriptional regulator
MRRCGPTPRTGWDRVRGKHAQRTIGPQTSVLRTTRGKAEPMMRNELLRRLGRREFTVRQVADVAGVSVEAARSRVVLLVRDGLIERTGEVLQYLSEEERPLRGRPSHLYRVVQRT